MMEGKVRYVIPAPAQGSSAGTMRFLRRKE